MFDKMAIKNYYKQPQGYYVSARQSTEMMYL